MIKEFILSISLIVMLSVSGCSSNPQAAPPSPTPTTAATTTPTAEFSVASLDVLPPEVYVGETATVSAVIENAGDAEGTYKATMTVDSAIEASRDVVIAPGGSEEVAFSFMRSTPGTYMVCIGQLSANLVVVEKEMVEVELKYDDGKAETFFAIAPPSGYLIGFSTPLDAFGRPTQFTLEKVKLLGGLWGTGWEGKVLAVEVWDSSYRVVRRETVPVSRFAFEDPSWVDVDMAGAVLAGDFYVHVFTNTGRNAGVHIGIDDSVPNEHSEATVNGSDGTAEIAQDWPVATGKWFDDKAKVNWMIRVTGKAG